MYLDKVDGFDPAQPLPGAGTSVGCVGVPKELEELLVRVYAADLRLVQLRGDSHEGDAEQHKVMGFAAVRPRARAGADGDDFLFLVWTVAWEAVSILSGGELSGPAADGL